MSPRHARMRRHRFHSGRDSHFYLYSEPEVVCYCDGVPCLCPTDVSGLVRDPVLSPGFYWYDAPPEQAPGFHQWLKDNASLVKVRKSNVDINDSVFGHAESHVWVLFEVLFPVPWLDAKKFGFPNTASKDTDSTVASSGAEPQKDPLDKIADSVKEIVPFLAPVSTGAIVIGGLVGLGYIFRKELFSNVRKLRNRRASRSR